MISHQVYSSFRLRTLAHGYSPQENLVNNNCMKLLLLPPPHLHCLCVWSGSEWVFESQVQETRCRSSRRISSTNQTTMNDNFGLPEDIVFREAVAVLDFKTSMKFAVSIHSTGVTMSNGDWNKAIAVQQVESANAADRFTVRNRINTDLDIADASQLGLLLLAVHTRDVCYNSWENEPVCLREDCSSTKPAPQEVNN